MRENIAQKPREVSPKVNNCKHKRQDECEQSKKNKILKRSWKLTELTVK